MSSISVRAAIEMPIAVSRDSARKLKLAMDEAFRISSRAEVDFSGIEAITPSFLDELVRVSEEGAGAALWSVVLLNMPSALTSKFATIGRSHRVPMEAAKDRWFLTPQDATGVPSPWKA